MKNARIATLLAAVLGVAMCFALAGCGSTGSKDVSLESTISDSALVSAGTLTVGVDTSQAPFASVATGEADSEGKTSGNQIVGLDVDVAAEIADEMGLKLKVVDLGDTNANTALKNKKVDVVMSASSSQNTSDERALVGPYLNNAAAIFGLDDGSSTTVKPENLKDAKVAAYTGSIAATEASQYCSTSNMTLSSSMKEMFQSLESGSVQYVASDVVSGGYMSMLYQGITCKGTFGTQNECYMAVLQSNSTLTQAITKALETIDGNGVLDVVIAKWCGDSAVQYASPTVKAATTDAQTTTGTSSSTDTSSSSTTQQ